MRVLFVHSRMPGGGVERVTLTLIEEFQKRGIICCLALRHARGELIEEARALAETVELAPSGIHQFVPRLARLIREFSPTHIVTAMPDVTLLTLIAQRRAASDARVVQGVHVTQQSAAYERGVRGWWRGGFERTLARLAYRRVDGIVAVSAGLREELRFEFGVAPQQIALIHNPVAGAAAMDRSADSHRAATSEIRFVSVGRLSREKGVDVLIRALHSVSGDWRCDIYGNGPESEALTKLVASGGLEDRVSLRGHTDDSGSAIAAADWLVLPSRSEGFGVVLVEAMARGVPVVASDCPHGPREILNDGEFGVLVRPNDIAALAAALQGVVDGRFQFDKEELRRRASNYSVSRSINQWLEMLEGAYQEAERG